MEYGDGETPESSGLKGDHLVGRYYVKFDQVYKAEMAELIRTGITEDQAKKQAPSLLRAQAMLIKWEQGDSEVVALWKKMNAWVYKGFDTSYHKLGVSFDKNYYESDTYILGKDDVRKGLKNGVFYSKEDGSVWINTPAVALLNSAFWPIGIAPPFLTSIPFFPTPTSP